MELSYLELFKIMFVATVGLGYGCAFVAFTIYIITSTYKFIAKPFKKD